MSKISIEERIQSSVDKINNFFDPIMEWSPFYVFVLISLVAFLSYSLILTFDFRSSQTAIIPQIVIVVTIVLLLIEIARVTILQHRDVSDSKPSSPEDHTGNEPEGELSALGICIQSGWVVIFILSMNIIGFFTTIVLFSFTYIFVHTDKPLPHRLAHSILPTIVITSLIWILFVEILNVASIFSLGLYI